MSDLQRYISKRRVKDVAFDEGFEEGYKAFKIGTQYSNEQLGDIRLVPDFLLSPEDLALRKEQTKDNSQS